MLAFQPEIDFRADAAPEVFCSAAKRQREVYRLRQLHLVHPARPASGSSAVLLPDSVSGAMPAGGVGGRSRALPLPWRRERVESASVRVTVLVLFDFWIAVIDVLARAGIQ
jgi:hypothetical protein